MGTVSCMKNISPLGIKENGFLLTEIAKKTQFSLMVHRPFDYVAVQLKSDVPKI